MARISIQNGENKTDRKKCSIYTICPSQQILCQSYIQATKKKPIQNRPNLENVFASNTAQELFFRTGTNNFKMQSERVTYGNCLCLDIVSNILSLIINRFINAEVSAENTTHIPQRDTKATAPCSPKY